MTHFLVLVKNRDLRHKHDLFISVYGIVASGGLTTSTELILSEFVYSLNSEFLSVCMKELSLPAILMAETIP